jgi:putative endonuclease
LPVVCRSRPGDRPAVATAHAAGRAGEELAARHFARRGFAVLERNLRRPGGEIDLIAFDGDTLVFAEVKTRVARYPDRAAATAGRRAMREPSPFEGLHPRQRHRLRRLASAWLSETSGTRPAARDLRFDAIAVLLDRNGNLLRLDHLEGAW